jgi:hypothetical protein
MLCASCKNKTSTDRCPAQPIKGLLFCGRHAKTRVKRLWVDIIGGESRISKIQKMWRGHFIRKRLRLAGEGVLNRSACHNTEELVTLDEKNKVGPLDYFSFKESDKLWWFDVRSLNQVMKTALKPLNPYTRQELSIETRQRLRETCRIRKKLGLPLFHDVSKLSFFQVVEEKWLHVCQIIEENGFFDMNHLLFTSLNRSQLLVMLNFIHQDLVSFASEHPAGSRRYQYVQWIRTCLANFMRNKPNRIEASFSVAKALLSILYDCRENYTVCFIIISSVCRM